ncbi:FxLYD domain-containing protein [Microbispora sp. CA-135349]|uniref:FxLYD domain-containing protein n=1 Tax=Microbispora sp. CA-135349 TaxID=3239953 RepID=UPI003D94C746
MTVALALAALAMASCAREDKQEGPQPLALKEQVSSIVRSGAGYAVTWAGVLNNPNRRHFGENAVAVVTAVDAAGKEVVHLEQPLDAVPPGRPLAFGGQVPSAAQPVRVKIDYRPASWRPIPRIPSAFLKFPISDVRTDKLKDGSYLVTGYVLDPFRKPVGGLAVTALLRDAAGKLVGGATSYVDNVRPGAKRRFVITVEGVREPVGATDVQATTWGSTARTYEDLARAGAVPLHTVAPTTEPFAKDRGYPPPNDRRQ